LTLGDRMWMLVFTLLTGWKASCSSNFLVTLVMCSVTLTQQSLIQGVS